MKMKLLALFVAMMSFAAAPALAQIGQTASLTGTITDSSGAVLPGVTVTVVERSGARRIADGGDRRERQLSLPRAAAGHL